MAKFLATHNIGPEWRETMAGIPEAMPAIREQYPTLTWEGSYVDPATGRFFCVWQAPSAEGIRKLFEVLEMPYEEIIEVEWATPFDLVAGATQ